MAAFCQPTVSVFRPGVRRFSEVDTQGFPYIFEAGGTHVTQHDTSQRQNRRSGGTLRLGSFVYTRTPTTVGGGAYTSPFVGGCVPFFDCGGCTERVLRPHAKTWRPHPPTTTTEATSKVGATLSITRATGGTVPRTSGTGRRARSKRGLYRGQSRQTRHSTGTERRRCSSRRATGGGLSTSVRLS